MVSKWAKACSIISATALFLGFSACGSANTNRSGTAEGITAEDVEKALTDNSKTVELTFWAPSYNAMKASVEAFQKKYPHIKIDFVNPGSSSDFNTKLQNAITAKKGVPEVVQFGYDSYGQFAMTGGLLNFKNDSLEKYLGDKYLDAAWKGVHLAGGLYAIPQDIAPMVMYVRQDILDQYGLKTPTTWDEFYEIGKQLHEKNPDLYMSYLELGQSKYWSNYYREAGAKIWGVGSDTSLSLDFDSDKAKSVDEFLTKCIRDGVLEPVNSGTDEFNRDMNNGRYASWIDEEWRGNLIRSSFPSQSGKWKVYQLPSWEKGAKSVTTGAGSVLSVTAATDPSKRAAAIAFADWINSSEESIQAFQDSNNGFFFMAAKSFRDNYGEGEEDPYFGQNVSKLYFEAADNINSDWEYLPFGVQLDTMFTDVMAPGLESKEDVATTASKYSDAIKNYAEKQGFTVTVK